MQSHVPRNARKSNSDCDGGASAGNNGKDFFGRKMYGGIKSPGIDPSVITVGASNTFGTDSRADDGVATFARPDPRLHDRQWREEV